MFASFRGFVGKPFGVEMLNRWAENCGNGFEGASLDSVMVVFSSEMFLDLSNN